MLRWLLLIGFLFINLPNVYAVDCPVTIDLSKDPDAANMREAILCLQSDVARLLESRRSNLESQGTKTSNRTWRGKRAYYAFLPRSYTIADGFFQVRMKSGAKLENFPCRERVVALRESDPKVHVYIGFVRDARKNGYTLKVGGSDHLLDCISKNSWLEIQTMIVE